MCMSSTGIDDDLFLGAFLTFLLMAITFEISEDPMEAPLPEQDTLRGLANVYFQKCDKPLPELFNEVFLKLKRNGDSKYEESAKSVELFCKTKEKAKLTKIYDDEVPDGILPPGYRGVLHDMKVAAHGPDDKIYKNHPEIRKRIPRGATTLELEGSEPFHDVVIFATKKFSAGPGDDDDASSPSEDRWSDYFIDDPNKAEKIVCMEKVNGDAVHFSGRYINGKFYLFAGSKNTHMIIRKKSDIDLYQGDRFQVSKRFAKTVWDTLESLEKDKQHLLFSLLHHTKVTAMCEVLQPDYQHIVDLSYLTENELNFIGFTPSASEEEGSLMAFIPDVALVLASSLGLTTAKFEVVEANKMEEQRSKVRKEKEKEGEVLYFLDGQNNTIGVVKAKSVWYICLRALREKVVYCFITAKKKPGWNLDDRIKSMKKRYNEIQRWLRLSDECTKGWKDIGEAFMKWLGPELKNGLDLKSLRPQFPVIWKKFLTATGCSDEISL